MAHSIDYEPIIDEETIIRKNLVEQQWRNLPWYKKIGYKLMDGIIDLFGIEGEAHFYHVPKFKVLEYKTYSVVDILVGNHKFSIFPSDFSIETFCSAVSELKHYEQTGKTIWILSNPSRNSVMRIVDKTEKKPDGTSKVIITLDLPRDWGIAF